MNLTGKVFITGGAGTLGKAILRRAHEENWDAQFTIYSTDPMKHKIIKEMYPKVTCVMGSVTDVDGLMLAIAGHDIVIHAAAMKHIVECERYPLATIDVNVFGSQNVFHVCAELGTPHVVAISTDKACLNWHETIHFKDGRKLPIGKVVRDRIEGKVLSLDETGEPTWKPITNWYKNKLDGRKMYSVTYEGAYKHRGMRTGVKVTEDHLILVFDKEDRKEKWVQAQYIDQKNHLLVTGEYFPIPNQRAILTAAIMGDGSIFGANKENERCYLKIGHCKKQEDWLEIKRRSLLNFRWGKLKTGRKNTKYEFLSYSSSASAYLTECKNDHYNLDGSRKIPRKDVRYAMSLENGKGLFLSTLYMDDGTISDNLARIATHAFNREDVEWLIGEFIDAGYECYLYNPKMGDAVYNEIRFTRKGSDKFYEDIAPYVPKSMQYKLPESERGKFEYGRWPNYPLGSRYLAKPDVIEIKAPKRDVYCIDVEDTHNFIVNDVVVHNCSPINTYGVSKMMMERILHAYAEKYTRTDFHLCRYGNVVGSTGSFIHNWRRDLSELGYVRSTVEEMTRFWMSEGDAVDVVLRALDIPSGCTLIPRPMTASIGDLESWLLPDGTKIEHLGTRIGEKMHESLLSGTESLRTTIAEEGKYFVLLPPQMENLFEFESQYELRSDNDKLRMDPKTALYLFGKVE